MRFTLISDVHVDVNPWDWHMLQHCDPTIPMVVTGDITNDVMETSAWIRDLRERFSCVIWVAGNHCMYNLGYHQTRLHDPEFRKQWPYPRTVEQIYDHYARWSAAHDVHFLNRSSVTVDGVEFVGVTGWHNFDAPHVPFDAQVGAWQHHMNDSRHIHWQNHASHDPTPVLQAARADAAYVRSQVNHNSHEKVVLSHHIPHEAFVKTTSNPMWNMLNGSFLNTELAPCVNHTVKAWCFGHTHFRTDQHRNHVRYINNARGYARENPNWSAMEIEI